MAKTDQSPDAAALQHLEINVQKNEGVRYTSALHREHWFPQAGLGMFIHWGLSSLGGNHDLSWSMIRDTRYDSDQKNENKLKPTDYFNLAQSFNASDYNPRKWLKAAKEAGFEYAVLTTKHHDGFALWPSEYGDFNTKNYLQGRNLVQEFVDACHENNLRVGFYYSPPDWRYERNYRSWGYRTAGTKESPHLDVNWEPILTLPQKPDDYQKNFAAYINGQIHELLTRFGKVDYLWFDGSEGDQIVSLEEIKKIQPEIIINDRQHGYGDVVTCHYECKLPENRPDHFWEHCFVMNNSFGVWSYVKREDGQPTSVLLSHLAITRSWNGNVLANYGPLPSGEMSENFYRQMKEMREWNSQNPNCFRGTQGGNYPENSNTPYALQENKILFYLQPDQKGEILYEHPTINPSIKPTATLLKGQIPVSCSVENNKIIIQVPEKMRTNLMDVIVLSF